VTKANLFIELTRNWSTDRHRRKEDQLTAAFITTLRLCPQYRRSLFREFEIPCKGGDPEFSLQYQQYNFLKDESRREDARIDFAGHHKILIENKLGAPLSREQVEKYRRSAFSECFIWFVYLDKPAILDDIHCKYFIETDWRRIHEHLFYFKHGKNAILDDFQEYLEEVVGVRSFKGFSKDTISKWQESSKMIEALEVFLEQYAQHVGEKKHSEDWKYQTLKESRNPITNSNGCDIHLQLNRKSGKFHFTKHCYLSVGFFDAISATEFWNEDEPVAYIQIDVKQNEIRKIHRRGSAHGSKIALSLSGFQDVPSKGRSVWLTMVKKQKLSKIVPSSRKNQYYALERFFDRGLMAAENHIFHQFERYR